MPPRHAERRRRRRIAHQRRVRRPTVVASDVAAAARRRRGPKAFAAAAVVGGTVLAGSTAWGVFGAGETVGANAFTTGTVTLTDDDAGAALFSLSNMKPGDGGSRCVVVTNAGSLASTVRLYGTASGALAPSTGVVVARGSMPAPAGGSCTGFVADTATHVPGMVPGVVYAGTFATLPTTFAGGIVDPTPSWATNESHAYRITVTLREGAAPGGSGALGLTWEAQR